MIEFLAATLAVTAPSLNDAVTAYRCGSPDRVAQVNVTAFNNSYSFRSLAILRSALSEDAEHLSKMVAPTATFVTFDGDVGIGPRSTGPSAAIEFFRKLAPGGYRFLSSGSGPFSTDPCGPAEVEITLLGNTPGVAGKFRFRYRDGILQNVSGSRSTEIAGSFTLSATK